MHSGSTFYGDPEMRGGFQWLPKDGLEVQNGTGDVFWKPVMSNAVSYENPVDDPLYSAHRKARTVQVILLYTYRIIP